MTKTEMPPQKSRPPPKSPKWEFWIDRGGTFTDVVARRPDGRIVIHKLLSENPDHYTDAAIQGIRDLMNISANQALPSEAIAAVKMGTTVATNALLERQGEDTLLVITRGFGDQLRIGYQERPQLFDLHVKLPPPLYCDVLEIIERVDAHGKLLVALDRDAAEAGLRAHYARGRRGVAIVLMHGYRYPAHEKQLAEIARRVGFTQVSVSHEVSPLMKLVSRGDTTVVDAYLSPILRRHVGRVAAELAGLEHHGGRLMFMQSSGGLTDAHFFQGKDAVLSGPAGGVVGMARVCEAAGFDRVIGFDMGGTSTDVSHYNREFEKVFETRVAGVRLRAPMLLIHTVAAGGGSILHFDGARYRVGPDSAGAHPGPASYRNDGPLTITDCNVMLGHLQADLFPAVFGPQANQTLDRAGVETRFAELAQQIAQATGAHTAPHQVAAGFRAVAVENMAGAIKKISVQRGYDVSDYTLCCFGGAGGQAACGVADALAMKRIFIHPYAGVLSAYGMGLADTVVSRHKTVETALSPATLTALAPQLQQLEQQGMAELEAQGESVDGLQSTSLLHLRYQDSDSSIVVGYRDHAAVVEQFEQRHQQRFGFISQDKPLVVESIRVEVIRPARPLTAMVHEADDDAPASAIERDCFIHGQWRKTPFYQRRQLAVEQPLPGPAVILDPTSTITVEPGWRARLTADNNLILERYRARRAAPAIGTQVDPVMLEIFNNLFMSIAEQMGAVLENTAASVNIKERLDFSCAVFDPHGGLVANAPHIPVHLGSMGESIKTIIRQRGADICPGDAYILNAPYNGGTHLPDVTVVKPVFGAANERLFYVAARGHHADIGGISPGSAPANSTSIEQEGIVIDNVKLVENGRFREQAIYQLLTDGPWPARNPAMNIADFKAQLAACEKGAQELTKMADHYGISTVHAYMQHVQDNAEESVRRVLQRLTDGAFTYAMDDGHRVSVAIQVDRRQRTARIDFTGTSAQHPGNFNAPTAVVRAAVLYVFRCLVADQIPLNEGCLKPLDIVIPPDSMISPAYPAAVIAGNVETSQLLVDALFGALRVVAASQGTMNNFIWGNARHQYYETICGGTGAGADFAGADAVHSHMTNSRLTDPEVLEWRFPVVLNSFAIRHGSGGHGQQPGGNGVIRKLLFLQPMTANVLSGHRIVPPYGMAGGGAGVVGRNRVEHPDGSVSELAGSEQIELQPGDVFVIETPGGGGWGAA